MPPSVWGGVVVLLMPWLVTGSQRWEEEPRSLAVNPGEEAVLACKVVNMGGDCRCEHFSQQFFVCLKEEKNSFSLITTRYICLSAQSIVHLTAQIQIMETRVANFF